MANWRWLELSRLHILIDATIDFVFTKPCIAGEARQPRVGTELVCRQSPPFAVGFVDLSSAQYHLAGTNLEQFLIK